MDGGCYNLVTWVITDGWRVLQHGDINGYRWMEGVTIHAGDINDYRWMEGVSLSGETNDNSFC